MNMPKLHVWVTCDRITCPPQETPVSQRPTRDFRRNRTWTRGKHWVHRHEQGVSQHSVFC